MNTKAIFESNLPEINHRGKVRDTYNLNEEMLLMIVTDRISAFDVIMDDPIPRKGEILTKMSEFWFQKTEHIIPNHFIGIASDPEIFKLISDFPIAKLLNEEIKKRAMVVKKAKRVDIECIVRGYITGSAWSEYSKNGTVNKIKIKESLVEADMFPEYIFTPSTKAEIGHDEPLSPNETIDLVGRQLFEDVKNKSLELYSFAHDYSKERGMLLADTKFEFGFIDNKLSLIDEALTPDSSRYWDISDYSPGSSPQPYDKQYLRNWLLNQDWDKKPPAPKIPQEIKSSTFNKYADCLERITNIKI
jgi:phosphoribosylaminoimidazole-succinocarboxamide synthase